MQDDDPRFRCPRCKHYKPAESFYRRRFTDPDAAKTCRDCCRIDRKGRLAPRYELIERIKLERGCEEPRCLGYPRDSVVLDFDHRPGAHKQFQIGNHMTRWSFAEWKARVLAEIDKCDVVCANCHRMRTYRDGRAHTQTDHDLRSGSFDDEPWMPDRDPLTLF